MKNIKNIKEKQEYSMDKNLTVGREIKTPEEIEKIRSSQRITDAVYCEILNFLKPGVTEIQIAEEIRRLMLKAGAEDIAFDTIAASGENGQFPHAVPSDRALQKGDLLTLDFGAKKDGYHSDMTRTVAIGCVTDEQRLIYNTVLAAQTAGIAALKAGVSCAAVDKTARDIIESAGYKDCFKHGLGHGVGLEIHEAPKLAPNSEDILQAGMVVTVEPGIYIENKLGVRIEDMLVVYADRIENLTCAGKELLIL